MKNYNMMPLEHDSEKTRSKSKQIDLHNSTSSSRSRRSPTIAFIPDRPPQPSRSPAQVKGRRRGGGVLAGGGTEAEAAAAARWVGGRRRRRRSGWRLEAEGGGDTGACAVEAGGRGRKWRGGDGAAEAERR
ncbi:Os02g0640900 [Oryza sativa Japonica Group]|uniref:Os02g0640900 protein n=1 Tax=Oryza sativa subsp. japonica TaxID=39947 RepID=A0A0P0VM93_ORYSJ|nr:Os02g0640900 [Oryza sativa Japonica Group]